MKRIGAEEAVHEAQKANNVLKARIQKLEADNAKMREAGQDLRMCIIPVSMPGEAACRKWDAALLPDSGWLKRKLVEERAKVFLEVAKGLKFQAANSECSSPILLIGVAEILEAKADKTRKEEA